MEVREGLAKALYSLQFACLHTGIIYHNISLRARLLIICFCVGVVGNGIIQGRRNCKWWMGFGVFHSESSCEEETTVWCTNTFSRVRERAHVWTCARTPGSIFVYMHKHWWLLYCTVGRKGQTPRFTSDKPSVLSTQQTLVPPVSGPNTPFHSPCDPAKSAAGPLSALAELLQRQKEVQRRIVSSSRCCSR